ncbi:Tex family protein [Caldanaerobius polysaccharolyticus]|uniref:Tex family protein n=1 Tax=Caldanaerobius polysaccharolyticus TaxID=44256 RepID=UPI000478F901|nr:Tex family protein [Caldanaerobius polysaccharolyticus]
MDLIVQLLCDEFKLKEFQVVNTIRLIDEGNTIPFIARYRKEMTGNLSDEVLRDFYDRLIYLRNLQQRKQDVIRLIDEQGKLTDELKGKILSCTTLQEVEDLYKPYRPKRRTRATVAKEKGLEPLAAFLMEQRDSGDVIGEAGRYIDPEKGVNTAEEALAGAMDIIAENISDDADIVRLIRSVTYNEGIIVTKGQKEEGSPYDMYYDYSEKVSSIVSHRVLAINRGEKEGYLSVKIQVDEEKLIDMIKKRIVKEDSISRSYLENACEDAYKRLIAPSVERDIRSQLTEKAEEQAIKVFKENLRRLLLQPPVKGKVVMGFDPAYRTGCKIAVVDETGKLLDTATVYPTPPQNEIQSAKQTLKELIYKYSVDIISLGNGTASRESELFISELISELDRDVKYCVVSEAGASVYSASKLGAEEFPDVNVSLRGAISIARRLQDPLAELVKIDPKSIGVGQYQHDVNQKKLEEALNGVVEDCVNSVGVDLNTASYSLLRYVSGITPALAKAIVEYRSEIGAFTSREQLKSVKRLGDKTFEQCAGFLRIPGGENILDNTAVHPESYGVVENLVALYGYKMVDLDEKKLQEIANGAKRQNIEDLAQKLGIGVPTLSDILNEMAKPGRDPRDELPPPIFHKEVMTIEQLRPGMVLTGTVRNVVDFGAFVDIGVHQDGLVHISEISDKFVRHPLDVLSVGDIVKVRVLDVDLKRNRISLSMRGI